MRESLKELFSKSLNFWNRLNLSPRLSQFQREYQTWIVVIRTELFITASKIFPAYHWSVSCVCGVDIGRVWFAVAIPKTKHSNKDSDRIKKIPSVRKSLRIPKSDNQEPIANLIELNRWTLTQQRRKWYQTRFYSASLSSIPAQFFSF